MPRCRQPGRSQRVFQRLEPHRTATGDSVAEILLAGVSPRRVGELLERLIGLSVSPGQVSRLAKRLDAQARVFHTRPIGTFVNDASIDRIIFGRVSYFHTRYAARVCPAFRKTKATA